MLEHTNSYEVSLFKVPKILYFTNNLIKTNINDMIDTIKNAFSNFVLAIRSIRCAELSLPVAISCREQKFDQLLKSYQVHLDYSSGLIKTLH